MLTANANDPSFACGYNLRLLAPDELCPECGRAVADSLQSDYLRHGALND